MLVLRKLEKLLHIVRGGDGAGPGAGGSWQKGSVLTHTHTLIHNTRSYTHSAQSDLASTTAAPAKVWPTFWGAGSFISTHTLRHTCTHRHAPAC